MKTIRQSHLSPSQNRWSAILDGTDEGEREALNDDITRTLSGRIRDMNLTVHLLRLYFDMSWRQRSRVSRAWLTWAALLSCPMILLDWIYLHDLLYPAMLIRVIVLPVSYGSLVWVWSKPRSDWIEGSTLPLAIITIMTSGGILGLAGSEQTPYRYLTAGLIAASTAIVIFPVTLFWTIAGTAAAVVCFVTFSLLDPLFSANHTIAFALFFALVLAALIPARHTITLLQQHAFVLNLRGALQERALASANQRLAVLAATDELTGLPNRRAFGHESTRLWNDTPERPRSLGIILFDIDHFKKLNDSAGHASGDRCLAAVAAAVRNAVPETGYCARYGGEEFICILADANPRSLQKVAQDIRAGIEALAWPNPGAGGRVTVSLGIALSAADRQPDSLAALISLADDALYRAKRRGRNCVAAAWDGPADLSDLHPLPLPLTA